MTSHVFEDGRCSKCGFTERSAAIFHWMDCDDVIEEYEMELDFETRAS